MVMRNQNDASGSSGWWEDLPPGIRERITAPAPRVENPGGGVSVSSPPDRRPSPALIWVRELSRLALLFLAVAIANVLFLLVALSFVASGTVQSPAPFAVPGR